MKTNAISDSVNNALQILDSTFENKQFLADMLNAVTLIETHISYNDFMQEILEQIPELNDSKGIFAKDVLTTLGLLLEGKAYAIRSIISECKLTDKRATFLRIKTDINQFKTDVTTNTCENLLAKKFDTQLQIDDLENNHCCDTRMTGETIDSFNRSNTSDSK